MQQRALKAAAAICAAVVLLSTSPSVLRGRPVIALSEPLPADSILPTPVPTDSPAPDPSPSDSPDPNANGEAHRVWPHETPDPSLDPTLDPTIAPSVDPSATGTPIATASPLAIPTPSTDPGSTGGYTFDDEFEGTALDPAWLRHFHCCGTLAGFDPSLTSVGNGTLAMHVDHRSTGWYGDLIDTKTTFTQEYGFFEARIRVPEGTGLWPAFWMYFAGNGTEAEIDQMEICANAIGANGGNDASLLHTTIHWAGGSVGSRYRTTDLSDDFHVYGVDWRADAVRFYLDGQLVWTFTDTAHIPQVPLPLILNLGVGGTWCGDPDSTTPDGATMLVDWVRARP